MSRLFKGCAVALGVLVLSACSGYGGTSSTNGITVFGTVDASATHTR